MLFGLLMSEACPVYEHFLWHSFQGSCWGTLSGYLLVRYLSHIRWQLIAVLFLSLSLPFEIILAHPLCLLIIVFSALSKCATCRRTRHKAQEDREGRESRGGRR